MLSNSFLIGRNPKIVVLAGVHGNETANVETLKRLLESEDLKKVNTGILFIIGNPKALEKNVRFIETDLNREFGMFSDSYEGQRAKEIAAAFESKDVLIDLHLTQTPTLAPFTGSIGHAKSIEFFKDMDIPVKDYILIDGLNPTSMSSDEYFLTKNPEGVALTFELGSILDNKESIIELGEKIVIAAVQLYTKSKKPMKRKVFFWQERQKIPNNGTTSLVEGISNFMTLKKNQIVAYDGEKPITCEKEVKALFPKYTKTKDSSILRVISQKDI